MGTWILKYNSERVHILLEGPHLDELIDEGFKAMEIALKAYQEED